MARTAIVQPAADKQTIKFAVSRAIAKWGIARLVENYEKEAEGVAALSGVAPFCKNLGVSVAELADALRQPCQATSLAWAKALADDEVAPVEVAPVQPAN